MSSTYVSEVKKCFQIHEDKMKAGQMAKYMKDKFQYFGIASPLRNSLSKPFLSKEKLPKIHEVPDIARQLWDCPARELQYFAMDLLQKYLKKCPQSWLGLFEDLVVKKSWWDTVDKLSAWHIGTYLKNYPEQKHACISKWMDSENIWLQRVCLIFQLKYHEATDFELLKSCIIQLHTSNEFFIRKAIGWSLRQHAKTNPEEVLRFVQTHPLSPLSYREATRHLLS